MVSVILFLKVKWYEILMSENILWTSNVEIQINIYPKNVKLNALPSLTAINMKASINSPLDTTNRNYHFINQ